VLAGTSPNCTGASSAIIRSLSRSKMSTEHLITTREQLAWGRHTSGPQHRRAKSQKLNLTPFGLPGSAVQTAAMIGGAASVSAAGNSCRPYEPEEC
jgi:hypothetical protein